MIHSLKRLVEAVHEEGGKIVFQIAHARRKSFKDIIGETPMGPSNKVRDPVYFFKSHAMTEGEIEKTIGTFAVQPGVPSRQAQMPGRHYKQSSYVLLLKAIPLNKVGDP